MDFYVPFDQIGVSVPGPWKNAAPNAGIRGSIINALLFPALMGEVLAVQDEAGLTRNAADNTQLLQALRSGKFKTFADSGTADAVNVVPITGYVGLALGTEITFRKSNAANASATPTLTISPGPGGTGSTITKTIAKEDGFGLAAGDLPAGALVTVKYDGISLFRVVGLRKSDASLTNAQFVSLLQQNISVITPAILNAQQTVSSFTPVVVLSDLPYNTETVLKSLSIPAGTSYVNGFGQVAYRNDSNTGSGGGRISFTTKLRLVNNTDGTSVDAQYIGGAILPNPSGSSGTQTSQPTSKQFFGLNPQKSYTLQLIGFKIDNVSSLVVLDGFIQATVA